MGFDFVEEEREVFGDSPKPRKKGAAFDAITTRTAEERLKRLKKQNEKLTLELKKTKGDSVSFEKHKREVLAANSTVKQQILAVPVRDGPTLGLTKEQILGLTESLKQALNDLAYERTDRDSTAPD